MLGNQCIHYADIMWIFEPTTSKGLLRYIRQTSETVLRMVYCIFPNLLLCDDLTNTWSKMYLTNESIAGTCTLVNCWHFTVSFPSSTHQTYSSHFFIDKISRVWCWVFLLPDFIIVNSAHIDRNSRGTLPKCPCLTGSFTWSRPLGI